MKISENIIIIILIIIIIVLVVDVRQKYYIFMCMS